MNSLIPPLCAVCNVDFRTSDSQTFLFYCTSFSAYSEKMNPCICHTWREWIKKLFMSSSSFSWSGSKVLQGEVSIIFAIILMVNDSVYILIISYHCVLRYCIRETHNLSTCAEKDHVSLFTCHVSPVTNVYYSAVRDTWLKNIV